jgi:colanic acid/amylovoran biosynthesis glycosyltransferase
MASRTTSQPGASAPVLYLVSQYPAVSHTFIRREIQALEALGVPVARFSIRPAEPLEDADDRKELARTHVLLARGVFGLARDTAATLLTRPWTWLRALGEALRLGWRSDRGLFRHLVYLAEACTLRLEAERVGARHVHAHFGANSTAVALLCNAVGGPTFSFTAHGTESFDQPRAMKLGEKAARARFVVAVCQYGRAQLLRWIAPADWDGVHVVRCGLDAELLGAEPGPPPERPRLVCVGRLSPEKGQLVLLEAAAVLAKEGVSLELVLVGDGPLRAELEARVVALGLSGSVRMTGSLDASRLRAEILASRALVLPSFAEGLPVVLTEALALGRPVIATAVGGVPELVWPGSGGWLVPPASADALASAMREALAAPVKQLAELAHEGRERVRRRHDAARGAARLAALFAAAGADSGATED